VNTTSTDALPFAAPCRVVSVRAPLRWVKLGWRDLRAAPVPSLCFGLVIALLSLAVAWLAWRFGGRWMVLVMLPLFVFVAPVLALGVYAISAGLERGERPSLGSCIREERCRLGDTMVYSLALLVVALLWLRAGSGVQVFYPSDGADFPRELLRFLVIGTAVGSVFALLAFAASAFSLPMLLDRRTDGMTAVVTSFNAVLRNKPAMAVWIALILLAVLVGFATGFIGLIVTMPWIGHATWHAYRETIDASAWPANTPAALRNEDPAVHVRRDGI
jgi:uncharacterized membrane protein